MDSQPDDRGSLVRRAAIRLSQILGGLWPFAALLVAWQAWISLGHVSPVVAPSPATVGAYLVDNHGMLLTELKYTIAVAALGLVLGMTLGLILAVAVWSSKVLGGFLIPVVVIVQSFPVVAMVPLIARVMGYDIKTVITIAIIISFFSTFILGRAGLDRHSAGAADVFRVLGATRRSFLWRLALPSAIPNLLIALRLCAANCILATLVGEYLMGTRGLGSLIAVAQSTQQLPLAWAAAVLASGVSIAAFFAASRIEKRGAKRWT